MEPIALTITDTSKAAGFGKTTTYKLIGEGKLCRAVTKPATGTPAVC
jgi:hypothetical protein